MNLTLNGKQQDVGDVENVAQLITSLGFADRPVLVEHNGQALLPEEFPTTALSDGDKLELIKIVAGG